MLLMNMAVNTDKAKDMDSEVRLTCKCLVKIAAVQNSNHYTIEFFCSVISLDRIVILAL